MADEEGKIAGQIPDAGQVAETAAPASAAARPEPVAAPKKKPNPRIHSRLRSAEFMTGHWTCCWT